MQECNYKCIRGIFYKTAFVVDKNLNHKVTKALSEIDTLLS